LANEETIVSYWRWKAQQLAVNNKKCLNCVEDNMEVYETMTCKKCAGLMLEWNQKARKENIPADHFWKYEAIKRQKEIKENKEGGN
jgi:hypothetical protein